ncbi:MAG: SAM-dependent chlorinase/fluorinase [Chloroflexi bacterium]|nr:SAM-dependent chlorinase/fluorinase [Chloroflexota bacterium]
MARALRTTRPATRPVISFLSDFGARDPSAAICRGVMLGIANDAQIVDISHEVAKWSIRDGAFLLATSVPYLPAGSTHVAVVDPGVGTTRRPVAIRTERGDALVGPDNGLLLPAAVRLGGVSEARVLENATLWLPRTSATFHGRDVFAPVAARLATGIAFDTVGPHIDAASLVRLPWPETAIEPGVLRTAVLYVDSFGNVKLGGRGGELSEALGALSGGDELIVDVLAGPLLVPWATTFGDVPVGSLFLFEDSHGWLGLAVNQGSAAQRLGLAEDAPVAIRRYVEPPPAGPEPEADDMPPPEAAEA